MASRLALRKFLYATPYTQTPTFTKLVHKCLATQTDTTNVDAIALSDSCVKRLKDIDKDNGRLRVIVTNGGCSGFQYLFELDKNVNGDDRIFEQDGAQVVVDQISLDLIKGSVIDFREEMIRSSFHVVDNPRAEMGCSCGVSFSIKE